MVLGVSNQGNYIQSNADRFPFAGACEQTTHSALIIGGHLQALDHFVTSQEEKESRCATKECYCYNKITFFCNKAFIRSRYEPADDTCQALTIVLLYRFSGELSKKNSQHKQVNIR